MTLVRSYHVTISVRRLGRQFKGHRRKCPGGAQTSARDRVSFWISYYHTVMDPANTRGFATQV